MMYIEVPMTNMVRKQVYIEKRQDALLKRVARRSGVSEAELIRGAIDRQLSGRIGGQTRNPERGWALLQAAWKARRQTGGHAYRFKREDAYAEREGRLVARRGRLP